jgi:hypothetical protein
MKVRDLYNWCKAYKHKDAEVYLVKDWEQIDEEGNLTDLYRLTNIADQMVIIDNGMDFEEEHEVILDFESERA